jgi:glycosyltransferase involved in cell wall biosynthesis
LGRECLLVATGREYASGSGRQAVARGGQYDGVTDPLPKVSVLVPVHNYERFVEASLQSALDQEYPAERLEIVAVDDGSTDGSAAVIQRVADRNPGRITFVRQENRGQIGTIDRARRESTGELIAFLDADDVWLPAKVRKQVAAFQAEPNVALVFCDLTTVDEHGTVLRSTVFDPGDPDMDPVKLYARVLRTNIIYGGASMYRADLLGEPPETLESWDWWLAVQATQRFAAGELAIGFVPINTAVGLDIAEPCHYTETNDPRHQRDQLRHLGSVSAL